MSPSIPIPAPRHNVAVVQSAPDVVELDFRGHVSDRAVEYAIERVREIARARFFLIDATHTESYDESILVPGVLLLRELRARGVERGVAVSDLPVHIIGSAVSFVASLKVDFVRTRGQALARLERYRSAP